MKKKELLRAFVFLCFFLHLYQVKGEEFELSSPDEKIEVHLHEGADKTWFLSLSYSKDTEREVVIPKVYLGLERDDMSFQKGLTLEDIGQVNHIKEAYTAIHGKQKERSNEANERSFRLKNASQGMMDVTVRAYNDGVCFRYTFPKSQPDSLLMKNEYTSYELAPSTDRWMQKFVTSYEGEYPHQKASITQGEWGYPSLLKLDNGSCWALISEADMHRDYCATKLSNQTSSHIYKVTYPAATDGNGVGSVYPKIPLPWTSPWRVIIMGQLNDIVESTLIEDVSAPNKLTNTDWIKPGVASWIYWAYNHGTMDYKRVCEYVDLAAEMGWAYTLFDWEWDQMSNGGTLEDAVKYAHSKGVKPMIWLNSGGKHNRVTSTPRDRLITHEARVQLFKWLNQIGVYGIKVDFFESDKQHMIRYYIDILEDAAEYQLMVNFHGSTVPRGWSRTYPNLMSMEGVYGAEQYNNSPYMTEIAAVLNTTLPYTRNVTGPMDYTPITFTDSQNKHITTNAHELALSVIFESGLQHFADRPKGFYDLPDVAKEFLSKVPAAWDHSFLVEGYPGEKVVMRRTKSDTIYVAGINGTNRNERFSLPLDFLNAGSIYKLSLTMDGKDSRRLNTLLSAVEQDGSLSLSWLPRGGFAARFSILTAGDLTELISKAEALYQLAAGQCGIKEGEYNPSWVQLLSDAIAQAKQSTATLAERYDALGKTYSGFCNEALVTAGEPDESLCQDVTVKYLKEARHFSRSDSPSTPTGRWGLLGNPWIVTPGILNQENNSRGGYDNYNNTRSICVQKWELNEDAISNGQIYQTSFAKLPAGTYRMKLNVESQYGLKSGEVYFVITKGDTLHTVPYLKDALAHSDMSTLNAGSHSNLCEFTLNEDAIITFGWLVNIASSASGRCLRVNDVRTMRKSNENSYTDVTADYLQNYTNIQRKDLDYKRFGTPENWTVENFKISQTDGSGTKQGIDKYSGFSELMIGIWDDLQRAEGNPADAKIYRLVTLPAGTYYIGAAYQTLYNLQYSYLFVSEELPSAAQVKEQSLSCHDLLKASADGSYYGTFFTLPKETKVYIGWIADLKRGNTRQEMRISQVKLARLLDSNKTHIKEEAFYPDSILSFSVKEFASIKEATFSLTPDHESYLRGVDGTVINLGAIDFGNQAIEKLSISTACIEKLRTDATFEIYLDEDNFPLCTLPVQLSAHPTSFQVSTHLLPPLFGTHTIRVVLNGHTSNVQKIDLIPYQQPDKARFPISSPEFEIIKENNRVTIHTTPGMQVRIYSLNGTLIKEDTLSENEYVISLDKGFYIIRIGTHSYKLIVQ